MNSANTPLVTSELTLEDAGLRIDALETSAAKAVALLSETMKHETVVNRHGEALLACVDLLFDELKLEGLQHNEYVENSLERTAIAVKELRLALSKQRVR